MSDDNIGQKPKYEEYTDHLGKPVSEVDDIEILRRASIKLWAIIDDIDTASDMAKGNTEWYEKRVDYLCQLRGQVFTSDGYNLFLPSTP